MASRGETETHVNYDHLNQEYLVFTNYGPHRRRFLKAVGEGRATLRSDDGEVAEFTVPRGEYDVTTGFKRRRAPLTDAQREEAADRLARALGR